MSPGMRFSMEPVAFSAAAAAVHKHTAKGAISFRSLKSADAAGVHCTAMTLHLPSASLAKSLLRSSSAVSLEKLSSPKGFQLGWVSGAAGAAGASAPPAWYTLCWDEQGEPDGVVLADLQCTEVETKTLLRVHSKVWSWMSGLWTLAFWCMQISELFKDRIEWLFLLRIPREVKGSFIPPSGGSFIWMGFLSPLSDPCHKSTVHPQITGGSEFCSLGLVEASLSCGSLEQLGGLADWNPEHGAVRDVAQYAPVTAFGRYLWRRGRRQWPDSVSHMISLLQRGQKDTEENQLDENVSDANRKKLFFFKVQQENPQTHNKQASKFHQKAKSERKEWLKIPQKPQGKRDNLLWKTRKFVQKQVHLIDNGNRRKLKKVIITVKRSSKATLSYLFITYYT